MVLSDEEKASFDGPYRTPTLSGPFTLMRLCGRNAAGQASNPYGRFWFKPKFFWDMVDLLSDRSSHHAELNHYLRLLLREATAVCYDWNSFAALYELRVPTGTRLEVTLGRIKPQPFYSKGDPRGRRALPHEILMGGEFQYIVDLKANPSLTRYVSGPRPLWVSRTGHA